MLRHIGGAIATASIVLLLAGCCGTGPSTVPVTTKSAQAIETPTGQPPIETRALETRTAEPTVAGPYLGQQPPGTFPAAFAPAIIRGDLHTPPVFMPDGNEVYWSTQEPAILVMRLVDGRWSQPRRVTFSASLTDYRDPFIAPSGDRLYFLSKGRLPGSQVPEKENIWYVDRLGQDWAEPQPLSETVNALPTHWQVSVAADRDLYFTSGSSGEMGDIHVSRYTDGSYTTPSKLAGSINTDQIELTPYVAPDERYLLFSRLADQASAPRLFVSFADATGSWGDPVLIDKVAYGLCPVVSPDGRYVFYLSSPQRVSWMSAQVIDELRPK